MSREILETLIGDTIQIIWVDSGVTPTALVAAVYTGSETLVDSGAMVSSGNGHFFKLHTVPSTPGYYVAETLATIDGFPYKRRRKYRAVLEEVD